jgi:hypothetical protein
VLRAALAFAAFAVLPAGLAAADRGVVRGVVVDGDGRGIEGASVSVETDPSRLSDDLAARTDASGAFEVRGVPVGRVLLRASHPSFAPAVVPEVLVEQDPGEPVHITLSRGARVEGRVSHRDGHPFTVGRVIVQGSAPAALYDWPRPLVPDEAGAFAVEHLSPGPARVHVLAFTPQRAPPGTGPVTTLSPIGAAATDLREGETTRVEITLRDVVVGGRVTRGGRGVGGVRVTLSGPARAISFPGMPADPPPAAPPMLSTTTREDGTYEVVAFEPGPARVDLSDTATGQALAGRQVLVADADRFALDLEITEAGVAGVVVRRESGAPLPGVALRLEPVGGGRPVGPAARSRDDGRFALGAEPGDYVLSAEIPGRVRLERPVSVPAGGLSDLRLEMDRGLAISGRLLDERGRPASAHAVFAAGADGFERAFTGKDGSFRLEGLTRRPYALSAGSSLAGFATRRGVRPASAPITLALRAGGRVELRTVSPEGRPVAEALVSVVTVDGERVDPGLCVATPTGEDGATTIGVPAGEVVLAVQAESGAAMQSVSVRSGDTVALEVRLGPEPD